MDRRRAGVGANQQEAMQGNGVRKPYPGHVTSKAASAQKRRLSSHRAAWCGVATKVVGKDHPYSELDDRRAGTRVSCETHAPGPSCRRPQRLLHSPPAVVRVQLLRNPPDKLSREDREERVVVAVDPDRGWPSSRGARAAKGEPSRHQDVVRQEGVAIKKGGRQWRGCDAAGVPRQQRWRKGHRRPVKATQLCKSVRWPSRPVRYA